MQTNNKQLLWLWTFGRLPTGISLGNLQKCLARMCGVPQMGGGDDLVGARGAGSERNHSRQNKGDSLLTTPQGGGGGPAEERLSCGSRWGLCLKGEGEEL